MLSEMHQIWYLGMQAYHLATLIHSRFEIFIFKRFFFFFPRSMVSGLPDGIFSNKESTFEQIWVGLRKKKVGVCILWPFGIYYGHLVYFMAIG
jgi:hypothetical protein